MNFASEELARKLHHVANRVRANETLHRDDELIDQAAHALKAGLGGLPAKVLAVCKKRGWDLRWPARGAYLHLEASELIEALRGKRGEPTSEAADVLIVLMSITENAGIPFADVIAAAERTVERLESAPRYKAEECST